jgi:hypothetical protein
MWEMPIDERGTLHVLLHRGFAFRRGDYAGKRIGVFSNRAEMIAAEPVHMNAFVLETLSAIEKKTTGSNRTAVKDAMDMLRGAME